MNNNDWLPTVTVTATPLPDVDIRIPIERFDFNTIRSELSAEQHKFVTGADWAKDLNIDMKFPNQSMQMLNEDADKIFDRSRRNKAMI